jgi:DNA-binding transcriptional ArsR family regulator
MLQEFKYEDITLKEDMLPVISVGTVLAHPIKVKICEIIEKHYELTAAQISRILKVPPANIYKLIGGMLRENVIIPSRTTSREVYLRLNKEYIHSAMKKMNEFFAFK